MCGYTMYDWAFDVKQLRKRRIRGVKEGRGEEEGAQEKGELECRTQLHNVHLHGCISARKARATSLRFAFRLSARARKIGLEHILSCVFLQRG